MENRSIFVNGGVNINNGILNNHGNNQNIIPGGHTQPIYYNGKTLINNHQSSGYPDFIDTSPINNSQKIENLHPVNLKHDRDSDLEFDETESLDYDGNSKGSSRKRYRLAPEQTRRLVEEFDKNAKPDSDTRKELGKELKMSPRKVQIWFQNRRAKIKRETGSGNFLQMYDYSGSYGTSFSNHTRLNFSNYNIKNNHLENTPNISNFSNNSMHIQNESELQFQSSNNQRNFGQYSFNPFSDFNCFNGNSINSGEQNFNSSLNIEKSRFYNENIPQLDSLGFQSQNLEYDANDAAGGFVGNIPNYMLINSEPYPTGYTEPSSIGIYKNGIDGFGDNSYGQMSTDLQNSDQQSFYNQETPNSSDSKLRGFSNRKFGNTFDGGQEIRDSLDMLTPLNTKDFDIGDGIPTSRELYLVRKKNLENILSINSEVKVVSVGNSENGYLPPRLIGENVSIPFDDPANASNAGNLAQLISGQEMRQFNEENNVSNNFINNNDGLKSTDGEINTNSQIENYGLNYQPISTFGNIEKDESLNVQESNSNFNSVFFSAPEQKDQLNIFFKNQNFDNGESNTLNQELNGSEFNESKLNSDFCPFNIVNGNSNSFINDREIPKGNDNEILNFQEANYNFTETKMGLSSVLDGRSEYNILKSSEISNNISEEVASKYLPGNNRTNNDFINQLGIYNCGYASGSLPKYNISSNSQYNSTNSVLCSKSETISLTLKNISDKKIKDSDSANDNSDKSSSSTIENKCQNIFFNSQDDLNMAASKKIPGFEQNLSEGLNNSSPQSDTTTKPDENKNNFAKNSSFFSLDQSGEISDNIFKLI
ncbi:Homeobox protein HD-10 [Smittium culicis]|uniref:Homeobox protein HD-10 n=1 Tax=Smittium culicis TaxID=133412 RepID=A0A1R1YFY1_9FUNG|nr:Homeobox protein HD-10 [Smittium culicis]